MDGNVEASRPHRVIAFLCATTAAPEFDAEVELVRVNSGYEAAAEMLSAPASALLVDLGRVTPAHVALLRLAGQLAVPVVAFGTISAELRADALARARLVAPEQAGESLAEILNLPPAGRGRPPAPGKEPAERPQARPQPAAAKKRAAHPETPAAGKPTRPGEALTQAELDAMLLGEL